MHPKKPQSPAEAPVAQSDRATVSATVAPDAATVRGSARPIVSLPKSREELRAEREALKAETLEQWAARVAPTLTAEQWGDLACWQQHRGDRVRDTPVAVAERIKHWTRDQRVSLMSHVKELAELLSYAERTVLSMRVSRFSTTPRGSARSDALSLRTLGLVESATWIDEYVDIEVRGFRFTPIGREVARVLGGAQ